MRADYESMIFSDLIVEPSIGTDSPGGITPGNLENINSIAVPVLACDRTLSIIKANASFYDNSGYEPGTLDGMHFRDLTISLVSGESVWDAAITGRKTTGIGEVKLPKGSAFYQIHAIPLVSQDQLSSSILIFFHSPYGDPVYPSYDSIRESLSDSAEILAEPDGTILCVSPPVYSISLFEPDLVSKGNLWTWELFLDLRTRVDEMVRGLMTGKITHSFCHAGNRFMISVRVHDVVVLKRKVLHIMINSFPGDNTEEDETKDTAFVSAIEHLSSSVCSGQFSYRIDLAGVHESRHSVALILNAMMEQCETHYTTLAKGIEQMKSGWIPTSIQCSTGGPFHDIFTNVNEALDSLQQMMATVESFTMLVTEGNLTVKGDTNGLCGYYQALISGMNQMLSRLNTPLLEMRRVAGEYASCRFSSSMDETIAYPGDFAAMKQSMDAIGIWCASVVGEIDRVSSHYADGDFTAHMSPRLEVTGDFITIRDSLDNIGVQVSESISSLRSAAGVLSQEADGIKKEIARISGDADILASYTTTVSDRTTCVQDEVSRMIVSSNAAMQALCEMNGKVQAVAQTSAQTHTLSAKGVLLANQSREGIDAISGAAGLVDSGISRIHEELIRIEKIIRVVTDNASQTNFLAINAAIEAAHAGSYGRGFAAIAGEVKQLAVRSKESTTNISETLEALNDAFRQVKETVFQVQGEIQSRSTGICEMVSLFEEMIKEVEVIAAMSRDTGILTHDQENRISDLHKRSLIIGDLMSQTTRDAEATAQTCSSSCSSVEQIAGHIETVAAYANEIHAQISRFTV